MSKKKKNWDEIKVTQIVFKVPGFSSQFKQDLAWWFKNDPKKAGKILDLVTVIMADPFTGIGKPEPLKYLDSDTWSRRIDLENRLIYRVTETQIDFLACRFHYE